MNNNDDSNKFFQGKKFNYKTLWWIILLMLCITYVILRLLGIISLNKTVENVVIPAGVILAIFPLISEASFLGFSIKKEINELKSNVKDEFVSIRSEIVNVRMNTTQTMNPIFYNGGFLGRDELDKVVTEKLSQIEANRGATTSDRNEEFLSEVTDDIVYLFKVRYILERKINILVTFHDFSNYLPLRKKIDSLFNNKFAIEYCSEIGRVQCNGLRDSIIEVISICNSAIHGKVPNEDYVDYVRGSMDKLLYYLNDMIRHFTEIEHVL